MVVCFEFRNFALHFVEPFAGDSDLEETIRFIR